MWYEVFWAKSVWWDGQLLLIVTHKGLEYSADCKTVYELASCAWAPIKGRPTDYLPEGHKIEWVRQHSMPQGPRQLCLFI